MTQTVLLGDLINIKSGKSRPEEGGVFPVYGGNGIFDSAPMPNMSEPTVIVGRVGAYCGSVYVENKPFWLSDNALGVTTKEGVDLNFIYYLLKSIDLNARSVGGAQPLLTQGILNKISVTVPELRTQKKIADILSSLDEKIELNRKMNETLEQMGQTIFRHYFIDNPESGKWERVKINDAVLVNKRGFSPKYSDFGVPVINQRCVRNGTVVEEAIQYHDNTQKQAPNSAYLQPNDILINSMGVGTLGRVSQVYSSPREYIIHGCITILRANPNIIDPIILGYYIKFLEPNITQMGSGTTGQTSLNNNLLGNIEIILPDKRIQDFISPTMYSLVMQIDENYAQIKTLIYLRDMLLPRLISGKIKL